MSQASTYRNIFWKDDETQTHASTSTIALELLLRSGTFSSVSVEKKNIGLGCELRIRGCKDVRFNCLKLVISHLLSDLQKMHGAFPVSSLSHNPLKSQITPYSPWALR